MAFLDFQKIKEDNPIEQVAERLGLELTVVGKQRRGPCPSGGGDERGFVITPEKQAWYSFAKETGGDVIALVSFVRGVSPKEAAQFLAEESTVPEKKNTPSPNQSKPSEGFKPLDYLDPDHEAVIALGFDPKDAERLGVGFAPRGLMRGMVAIPVRLDDGTLCGYVGATELKLPPKWS